MSGAKKSSTPLSTSVSLKLSDGTAVATTEEYRKIIEAL